MYPLGNAICWPDQGQQNLHSRAFRTVQACCTTWDVVGRGQGRHAHTGNTPNCTDMQPCRPWCLATPTSTVWQLQHGIYLRNEPLAEVILSHGQITLVRAISGVACGVAGQGRCRVGGRGRRRCMSHAWFGSLCILWHGSINAFPRAPQINLNASKHSIQKGVHVPHRWQCRPSRGRICRPCRACRASEDREGEQGVANQCELYRGMR